jgi:hypothetical protein
MLRGSRNLGKIIGYSLSPIKRSPSRRLDLSCRVGRGDIWRQQWELLENRAHNMPEGSSSTGVGSCPAVTKKQTTCFPSTYLFEFEMCPSSESRRHCDLNPCQILGFSFFMGISSWPLMCVHSFRSLFQVKYLKTRRDWQTVITLACCSASVLVTQHLMFFLNCWLYRRDI